MSNDWQLPWSGRCCAFLKSSMLFNPPRTSLYHCGRSTSIDGSPVCNVIRCAQKLQVYALHLRRVESWTPWNLDPSSPPKVMSFRPQQTPVVAVLSTASCGNVLMGDANPWHPCYAPTVVLVMDANITSSLATTFPSLAVRTCWRLLPISTDCTIIMCSALALLRVWIQTMPSLDKAFFINSLISLFGSVAVSHSDAVEMVDADSSQGRRHHVVTFDQVARAGFHGARSLVVPLHYCCWWQASPQLGLETPLSEWLDNSRQFASCSCLHLMSADTSHM